MPDCRPIRPKRTCVLLVPKPKNVVLEPSLPLPLPPRLLLAFLPETSSAARCSAATLSACAPSFAAFLGPWARFPRAVKSEMMTFVW